MPCFYPIQAYRAKKINRETGKRQLVFNKKDGFLDMEVQIPCGQCIGCRLERSRQWAIRCMHESSLYENNCFITLTYHDQFLPPGNSLNKKHFQDFMKRLRKSVAPLKIRYFHCGEYGDESNRPHYHACLFNIDFADKILYSTKNGVRLYVSKRLQALWPFGFCTIGDVTFESAAYVARYVLKKVTGEKAVDHYLSVDTDTGEIHTIEPEYVTMSRRPGLATGYFEKYGKEIYPDDFIVIRGKKMKPPKFYDKLAEQETKKMLMVKQKRIKKADKRKGDNTYDRLIVKEQIVKATIKNKPRKLK